MGMISELGVKRRCLLVPIVFFHLGQIGGLSEQGFQIGVIKMGQGGERFAAQAVAGESRI